VKSGAQTLSSIARGRLARETGTVFKDAPTRVALCYPSPYQVGMSSLGFQTIYGRINQASGACAERVFLPDDVASAREQGPLCTVETQRPAGDAQVIAFSVAYELEITGVFDLLSLMGLPVLSRERADHAPLVVAGGPLTFSNPDPLEPFVDVLVQGEADDLVEPLLRAVEAGGGKRAILERLAHFPGFRVPGLSLATTRYFVAKAKDSSLPAATVVRTPDTELSNMFLIEPERGCSRGCHYCVMRRTTNGGMRTVPMERVLEHIPLDARRVGLVGAAVTDHPKIVELLEALVARGCEVGVSSLRADRLSQRLVNALYQGGAQGLTVASDGPSQRLRNMVDRKHSEEQLLNAARFAKTAGLKRLKVYNVVGLPTETDADIDELARFTLELAQILPVALGIAPFVAKRHTPLDGSPFSGIDVVDGRLARLRKALKGRAEIRPTSARWAWVEYVLAQCGPEAGLAALEAWKAGGRFADYKRAFEAQAVKPFLAARTPDGRRNGVEWPTVGA
jgi:radical SAM superfamily enzyme YgiQ (UPF0313 family)